MGAGLCRAVTCIKYVEWYGGAASSWFVIRSVVHGHRYRVVVVQRESGLPPSTP
jgi:hypothetical protein